MADDKLKCSFETGTLHFADVPNTLSCICPPADKGHAYGKITPGCPIHAAPVDVLFNLPGGDEI